MPSSLKAVTPSSPTHTVDQRRPSSGNMSVDGVFNKMGVDRVLSEIRMLSCLFVADALEILFSGRRARPLIGILANAVTLIGVVLINLMNEEPLRWAWRALAGEEAP